MPQKSEAAVAVLAVASTATYPLLGDWLYILIGAACGAFFYFTRSNEAPKTAGIKAFGSLLFSIALSGVAAHYISRATGDDVQIWLSPAAAIIAAFSDHIARFIKEVLPEWIPVLKRKKEGA